jgi:integrase
MPIFKRGNVYWFNFWWNTKHVQQSTRQGNPRIARQMEAAYKTSLAQGAVGIKKYQPVPSLNEFCQQRFEPWAKANFERTSHKSWLWYRVGMRAIREYSPLAGRKMDEITTEHIADFASYRHSKNLQVSTVNSSLRVLRRILRLAVEWGVVSSSPKVKLLRGERHRDRVLSQKEEARYLAAAIQPLSDIAAVLTDTGMRPEECLRLRWEAITWTNGRHGTLLVTHGKTAAARRVLPMTKRVHDILEARWQKSDRPDDGWVWPARTHSSHVEASTLKKQHHKALKNSGVRPFVLYSLRHTFLTRLGESGCDAWTLARIAGHSSIAMSARYVHPSEDAVLSAMAKLQSGAAARSLPPITQ